MSPYVNEPFYAFCDVQSYVYHRRQADYFSVPDMSCRVKHLTLDAEGALLLKTHR